MSKNVKLSKYKRKDIAGAAGIEPTYSNYAFNDRVETGGDTPPLCPLSFIYSKLFQKISQELSFGHRIK